MCLYIKDYNRPTEVQKVYKAVLVTLEGKIVAPIQCNEIKLNSWYKAEHVFKNKIKRFLARRLWHRLAFKLDLVKFNYQINGGAIHVFTSREEAVKQFPPVAGYKILVCDACPDDFIANGLDFEACYTKIFVLKEGNEWVY